MSHSFVRFCRLLGCIFLFCESVDCFVLFCGISREQVLIFYLFMKRMHLRLSVIHFI